VFTICSNLANILIYKSHQNTHSSEQQVGLKTEVRQKAPRKNKTLIRCFYLRKKGRKYRILPKWMGMETDSWLTPAFSCFTHTEQTDLL